MSLPFPSVPANGKQEETSRHDMETAAGVIGVSLPGVMQSSAANAAAREPVKQAEHSALLHSALPTHSEQ